MRITCPECGFERALDPTQVPASAVMATCPQCGLRFRFRSLDAPPLPSDDPNRSRPPLLSDYADTESDFPDSPDLPDSPDSPDSPDMPEIAETVSPPAAPSPALSAPLARPAVPDGDDPLPPGAITPGEPRPDSGETNAPRARSAQKPKAAGAALRARSGVDQNTSTTEDDRHSSDAAPGSEERNAGHSSASWRARSLFSGSGTSDIPWETVPPSGLATAWYQTMLRVLFAAPAFFTSVGKSQAGLVRPCLFFVLLGTFQSVVDHLWFMSRLTEWAAMQDANVQAGISAFSQGLNMPVLILIMPLMLLMQLLFYAGLFNLMIRLVQPEKADLITTIRVLAYSAAPGVLSLVPVVGTQVAGLWFAICCLIGCKHALDLTWSRTALAILPLYVLGLALSLHAMRVLMSIAQQ